MSQQRLYPNKQWELPSYDMPCRNEVHQSYFIPVLPLGSYASNDNVKPQPINQLFNYYNQNKNYSQNQEEPISQQKDGLFEIQKKRKKQKYKRSTNNSHKKFISALRRIFYSVISIKEKDQFETKYAKYRSCRTFFFIILAYMKYRFSEKLLNSVKHSFIKEMRIKIKEYELEIQRTKNRNLQNFRKEEIVDIDFSIKSCIKFLNGDTRSAIECMYKKDKTTVIKRTHFEHATKSMYEIQKELREDPKTPLESPYVEDFSNSSDRQKIERKACRREIRNNLMNDSHQKLYSGMDSGFDFGVGAFQDNFEQKFKQIRRTTDSQNPKSVEEQISEELSQERQIIYPPIREAIPFIKYDPFLPPFRYKRETRYLTDVREDFFGPFNYGFPKYYEKPQYPTNTNQQLSFWQSYARKF